MSTDVKILSKTVANNTEQNVKIPAWPSGAYSRDARLIQYSKIHVIHCIKG